MCIQKQLSKTRRLSMKNKVISILLSTTIVASSLIMGGCGSSESTASTATSVATDSTTTDSTAQDTSTDASATSESTAEAADETPVTITYYTWAQSNDGSYPQSVTDFLSCHQTDLL